MSLIVNGVDIERVVLVSENGVSRNLDMETVISNGVTVWEHAESHYLVQNGVIVDSGMVDYYTYNSTSASAGRGTNPPYYANSGNQLKYRLKNTNGYSKFIITIRYWRYANYGATRFNFNGVQQNVPTTAWVTWTEYTVETTSLTGYLESWATNNSGEPTWAAETHVTIKNIYAVKG